MRHTSLYLLPLLFLASCGQKAVTMLDDEPLSGHVRQVVMSELDAAADSEDLVSQTVFSFSKDGLLLSRRDSMADMHHVRISMFEYDSLNRIAARRDYEDEVLRCTHTVRYDNEGHLIERHTIREECRPAELELLSYDTMGFLTREERYMDDVPAGRFEYTYDSLGHKRADRWYDANGDLAYGSDFCYGDSGHVTESHFFGSDHRLSTRRESRFRPDGQRREEHHFDSFGHRQGDLYYTYDRHGRLTEEKMLTAAGEQLWRRVLTYDGEGNWVENTFYSSDNVPTTIIRRTIFYY